MRRIVFVIFLLVSVHLSAQDNDTTLPVFTSRDIITFKKDPVVTYGHGSIIDESGNEIERTPKFVASLLKFYTNNMIELLDEREREEHQSFLKNLLFNDRLKPKDGSEQLAIDIAILERLISVARLDDGGEMQGKLNLFRGDIGLVQKDFTKKLEAFLPENPTFIPLFATVNSGTAYINECASEDVPIPPSWGDASWIPTGSLSNSEEFISRGFEAKPHVFVAPNGVCIALPREALTDDAMPPITYSAGDEALLGIICQGETSGKVCFWDNQRNDMATASRHSLQGNLFPLMIPTLRTIRTFQITPTAPIWTLLEVQNSLVVTAAYALAVMQEKIRTHFIQELR